MRASGKSVLKLVLYYFVYIHTLATFRDLLDKPPEIVDVFHLFRDVSYLWDEIGGELHVTLNERESLRRDVSLPDEGKLERVFCSWFYNETTDVKWRIILNVMQALQRKDKIRKVINYLETPEVYNKYLLKDDISPLVF